MGVNIQWEMLTLITFIKLNIVREAKYQLAFNKSLILLYFILKYDIILKKFILM